MNRKHLVLLTWMVALVGMIFVAMPFAESMRPSAQAQAVRPRLDISQLRAGNYALVDHPIRDDLGSGFRWSILMFRRADGTLHAWNVPTLHGRIGMPDVHWWKPFHVCANFGLAEVAGTFEDSHLTCRDGDLPDGAWSQQWRWRVDGTAIDSTMDDMEATDGYVEGQYFVLGNPP